jgi:hypothetical protein
LVIMPYCENCGQPLNPNANFCGSCGTPRKQPAQPNTIPPPPPTPTLQEAPAAPPHHQPATEQIVNFLIATKSKRFGGEDYYTGIITSHRLIFTPMTKDNLKEVTIINRQSIKSGYSALPVFPYQQTYLAMSPEVLAQTQGCIVIANITIREITLRIVDVNSDGYSVGQQYEMQIKTDVGTQTFNMTKRDEYPARLRQVYREKVNT